MPASITEQPSYLTPTLDMSACVFCQLDPLLSVTLASFRCLSPLPSHMLTPLPLSPSKTAAEPGWQPRPHSLVRSHC